MQISQLTLLLGVVALGGCTNEGTLQPATRPQGAQKFTLTWPDYDGLFDHYAQASYLLNGRFIGRGDAGFESLLERMRHFPVGSILRMEFRPHDPTGGGAPYALPFPDRNKFFRVADSRRIKLEFPPEGAGWY